MIIDSFADKQSVIDISTLTLSEPIKRKEFWFDPERDLLENDWKEFDEDVTHFRGTIFDTFIKHDLSRWAERLDSAALSLSPKRKKELGIDEKLHRNLIYCLEEERARKEPNWNIWLRLALFARNLNPAFIKDLKLDQSLFESLQSLTSPDGSSPSSLSWRIIQIGQLFPDKVTDLLKHCNSSLSNDLEEDAKECLASENWRDFLYAKAASRVLFPGRETKLDGQTIAKIKKDLDFRREESKFGTFFWLVYCVVILEAEEARIGPEGLVINLQKTNSLGLIEKIPDMPVKRAF